MSKEPSESMFSLQHLENLVRNKTFNTNWLFLEQFNTDLYEDLLGALNSLETKETKPKFEASNQTTTHQKRIKAGNTFAQKKVEIDRPKKRDVPPEEPQVSISIDPNEERLKTADTSFDPLTATNLDSLKFRVKNCIWCGLCNERKSVVFGQGNQKADIIFIGDQPEKDDDSRGIAFWGKAGKLLTQMILSIGINRDAVYITNIIKCRTPGDREPQQVEVITCQPILNKQVEILKPKLIVALGEKSFQSLTGQKISLKQARGKFYSYKDIPLLATYHPNDLAKMRSRNSEAWSDFRRIRQFVFS